MSDLFGNYIVGFPTRRLIYNTNLPKVKNIHYENLPMQYTEIFLALKIESFQLKIFDILLILFKT